MGPGEKFGSSFCRSGRVSHLLAWQISPKNLKFYNFFPCRSKKYHWVRSKSTQVKGGLASYTVSQKYAWVGSGARAHL